jgi:hypothetical protein
MVGEKLCAWVIGMKWGMKKSKRRKYCKIKEIKKHRIRSY